MQVINSCEQSLNYNKHLHLETAFCVYLCYLYLIFTFVWWSETCNCDKHALFKPLYKKSFRADQTDRGGSVYFSYSNYILFWMDSENVFSSLQSGCNQGSMAQKKRIHRQMLQLQPFSLLPHRLTLLNTLTHMRTQSQMGKGKAVALPTWENDCQACTQHTIFSSFHKSKKIYLFLNKQSETADSEWPGYIWTNITERRSKSNSSGKE